MRKIYQKKKNSQLFYDFSKRPDVRHGTNNGKITICHAELVSGSCRKYLQQDAELRLLTMTAKNNCQKM